MMRMIRPALILLASSFLPSPCLPAPAQEDPAPGWSIPVQEYRLKNGLRVILSEDDSFPLVTVAIAYGAGTVRERPGQEGLAYLIENLMFQGSENVGPLQHVSYVQKVGGELNATTQFDKTLFYQTLPSNQLALALWLESDRMRSANVTPSSIERQRGALLEEHVGRLARDPYLESFSVFDALLFPDPRYGRSVIGNGAELALIANTEVSEFYQAFYVPNNAVLCIVGNIQPAKTRELVARYFESLSPGPGVPPTPPPQFEQEGEMAAAMPGVPIPNSGFHLGYRFYPLQSGDAYSLRILEYVLLRGKTARLRARLLDKDRTAYHLSGGLEERGRALGLKIFCLTNNAVMSDRSQRAILSEIEKVRSGQVSDDELAKAKRFFKMDYLRRLATGQDRAVVLIEAAFSDRPLDSLADELDRHLRVSSSSLANLVARYFLPANRAVLRLGPR
jgi:zinc protease